MNNAARPPRKRRNGTVFTIKPNLGIFIFVSTVLGRLFNSTTFSSLGGGKNSKTPTELSSCSRGNIAHQRSLPKDFKEARGVLDDVTGRLDKIFEHSEKNIIDNSDAMSQSCL